MAENDLTRSDGSSLNRVMVLTFQNWAVSDDKWKKQYKDLPGEAKRLIEEVLTLIHDYTPISFHLWWSQYHARYDHYGLSSENIRLFHNMMVAFFCFYVAQTRQGKTDGEEKTQKVGARSDSRDSLSKAPNLKKRKGSNKKNR